MKLRADKSPLDFPVELSIFERACLYVYLWFRFKYVHRGAGPISTRRSTLSMQQVDPPHITSSCSEIHRASDPKNPGRGDGTAQISIG